MAQPVLIYSGGNNKKTSEIARRHGIKVGAQLPATTYGRIYFADLNFKKPNRAAYMAALAEHRPHMAVVLDLMRIDMFSEVLDWACEAAQYVQQVVIVPKVVGIVRCIPSVLSGCEVVLGLPVWNSYTMQKHAPIPEFYGRKVHILGGSLLKQIRLYVELRDRCEIVSVDGNYAFRIGMYGRFFENGREVQGGYQGKDFPYYCFNRSMQNWLKEWSEIDGYQLSLF